MSDTPTDTVTRVRRDLACAAASWFNASANMEDTALTDRQRSGLQGAAEMNGVRAYAMAALLGEMARSGKPWTAEETALFLEDLMVNGDDGELNADVMPPADGVADEQVDLRPPCPEGRCTC